MNVSRRTLHLFLGALLFVIGAVATVQGQEEQAGGSAPVFHVTISGPITPGAAALLEHAITVAEAGEAAALIVQIDTPGGLISTTRNMVNAIAESRVPVVGYVGPTGASATSAGAFILLATHVAVMNDGTNVGASSPVAGDGSDIEGTMGKKVMNDSRAFMRSIATTRGRNADLAETFVSEAESLTAQEAAEQNIIDFTVPQFSQLLPALHGYTFEFRGEQQTLQIANSEIRAIQPRLLDRLLSIVAQPQIAHLLLSLGMLAIYFEMMSPGIAIPGVIGSIAIILGLIGVQALPVNVGFLLLLFLGAILMIAELFVAGFGVLGIGGAAAFILGSFKLFDMPMTEDHRSTVLSVSVGVSAAVLFTTFVISRSLRRQTKAVPNLVGKNGEAMVDFSSEGFVLVDGKRWPAVTEQPVMHGEAVEVIGEQHGKLHIRPKG